MQQKFTLHCTLAKWDACAWACSDEWYSHQGPDLNGLKNEFDDWVKTPEVSARLLSWKVLNIHESISTKRRNNQWRAILKLRKCEGQRVLYDFKLRFETIYELKQLNAKDNIHYSLDEWSDN